MIKVAPLDNDKLRLVVAKYWNNYYESCTGHECKEWRKELKLIEQRIENTEYKELLDMYNRNYSGTIGQLEL